MVRRIIETIERLHATGAERCDDPRSLEVVDRLARCLQELRAIAALEALDRVRRRPALRIV